MGNSGLSRRAGAWVAAAALVAGGIATVSIMATPAAAAVAVCGHTAEQPTLRQGSTGIEVTEAQCELNLAMKASGYVPIEADGQFGPATGQRVQAFQRCAGLDADGVIGADTWPKLNEWAAKPRPCAAQGSGGAASVAVCGHSTETPTLRKGAAGAPAKEVQCRLNLTMKPAYFGPLVIDGAFGGGTENRVKAFQRCASLLADGVVGENTWRRLKDWSTRQAYCDPPRPAGYPIDGVDTAKYQHPGGAAIDWTALRASGVDFATLKATRGTNVADEYFAADFTAARGAGLAVAPYHFYTATAANTGAAQAEKFIAAVRAAGYTGRRAGELPPVFDFEYADTGGGGCPAYGTVADAKAWLDTVEAEFGRKPIIYTQKSFLDACFASSTAFSGYQMQLADYRQAITAPPLPAGSSTWLMWQYTEAATLPGIASTVTADVFNGTQADLDRLANRAV